MAEYSKYQKVQIKMICWFWNIPPHSILIAIMLTATTNTVNRYMHVFYTHVLANTNTINKMWLATNFNICLLVVDLQNVPSHSLYDQLCCDYTKPGLYLRRRAAIRRKRGKKLTLSAVCVCVQLCAHVHVCVSVCIMQSKLEYTHVTDKPLAIHPDTSKISPLSRLTGVNRAEHKQKVTGTAVCH